MERGADSLGNTYIKSKKSVPSVQTETHTTFIKDGVKTNIRPGSQVEGPEQFKPISIQGSRSRGRNWQQLLRAVQLLPKYHPDTAKRDGVGKANGRNCGT